MEELLAYIYSLMAFTEKSWQALQPALAEVEFAKGDDLLKAGKVCNALFFIVRGYCRAFYNEDGQEVNTSFFFEGEIATNISSFGDGRPSLFSIQACEPVTAIRFNKVGLREAARENADIETLGRKCLQLIAGKQEKFGAIFQRLNPEGRYDWLQEHYPEILQRVPQTQLASFLGVARETVSRIRGRRS
ncbi:MAG: Crp/Fnr family transcriptional regulator [Bacteroidota bacterium]|nr:Crp/Fnr family transcriptional regulator [Bacteroidota bacterium]